MKQDRTSKFSKKAKKSVKNIKKQNETHQQQEQKMSTLISMAVAIKRDKQYIAKIFQPTAQFFSSSRSCFDQLP